MPHEAVLAPIYTALKALLAGYAPLTALLSTKPVGSGAAIYDEGSVLQSATFPYLTVGAGTQVPGHRMGGLGSARFGWNCTVQIKAVWQGGSEAGGLAIMSQVAARLEDGTNLGLAGYSTSWVEEFTLQPTIITAVAGITTREWPAIIRVQAHD